MDAELKARWVAALRSGHYEQGKKALRKIDGGTVRHCCLGVLCDLLDPQGWSPGRTSHHSQFTYNQGEPGEHGVAVTTPLSHVGLHDHQLDMLMGMNDEGRSFSEIADHIRENL